MYLLPHVEVDAITLNVRLVLIGPNCCLIGELNHLLMLITMNPVLPWVQACNTGHLDVDNLYRQSLLVNGYFFSIVDIKTIILHLF